MNLACETGFEEKGFVKAKFLWKGKRFHWNKDSGDQNLVVGRRRMADDRESQEEEAPIQPPIDSESWCRFVNTTRCFEFNFSSFQACFQFI